MKAPLAANVAAAITFSAILGSSIPSTKNSFSMPFFQQYDTANDIPTSVIKNHGSISGKVLKVIDGDTIRIRHYNLYPFVQSSSYTGPLSQNTISVRIYGVDAPELGKRGNPSMPKAEEARDWTEKFVNNKIVKVKLLRKDQYGRVVGAVRVRNKIPLLPDKDLSLELAKNGYATLYTSGGAEYNEKRDKLEKNIEYARRKKLGVWSNGPDNVLSPAEYKKKIKTQSK